MTPSSRRHPSVFRGHHPLLLLILLIFVVQCSAITRTQIEQVAEKCCTVSKKDCCRDMLLYGKPIGCGYEKSIEWAPLLYQCVQDEIFADKNLRMDLGDGVCCHVYANDLNDESQKCWSTCRNVMQAPSIAGPERIRKIKECSIVENPLYQCFQKCRQLRSEGKKIEVIKFNEYCNTTYLQSHQWSPKKIVEDDPNDNYQKV